jgi:hypothetical protein
MDQPTDPLTPIRRKLKKKQKKNMEGINRNQEKKIRMEGRKKRRDGIKGETENLKKINF